jgi:hypothetical protein
MTKRIGGPSFGGRRVRDRLDIDTRRDEAIEEDMRARR